MPGRLVTVGVQGVFCKIPKMSHIKITLMIEELFTRIIQRIAQCNDKSRVSRVNVGKYTTKDRK